ncbi:MAG: zinc ribbon domain-containing protein [Phormidium sp.]
MAYQCDLGNNQTVYLDNSGSQTVVTTASGSPGQQQQSSNRFETGAWTAPPEMYRTPGGIALKIQAQEGDRWIQIQGQTSNLSEASSIPLQEVSEVPGSSQEPMEPMQPMEPMKPMQPMQPMQPMKPMKMGNMEMNNNPMEMRMGNMEMRMGSSPQNTSSQRRFCSQCGSPVQASDRFCGNCGHKLS